jgi:transcriptional regulator with GAF, ATPase, and Fis domain
VRELENIIERAVITSQDGHLNLDRALPDVAALPQDDEGAPKEASAKVRTLQELRNEERANILLALESCGWRVAGKNGAANLLGMNPSTLSSRMRALGIARPR